MTYLVAVLFAVLFVGNVVAGGLVNVFVAGFMLGVGYMVAIQWYVDRKLNKEIMKEIETLSRNYDNQLKFNWDYPSARWSNLDQDFSENQMKQEHTRND